MQLKTNFWWSKTFRSLIAHATLLFAVFSSHPSRIPHEITIIQNSYLTLESQRGSDLVAGLVEFVSIERQSQTDGGTCVQFGAVSEGGDAAVVDLDLWETYISKSS